LTIEPRTDYRRLLFHHILSGRGFERRKPSAAKAGRRLALVARAFVDPPEPMVPPRALLLGGFLQPRVGIVPHRGIDVVPGFEVGRRTHQGLDVAAGVEHELAPSAEQPRAVVDRAP